MTMYARSVQCAVVCLAVMLVNGDWTQEAESAMSADQAQPHAMAAEPRIGTMEDAPIETALMEREGVPIQDPHEEPMTSKMADVNTVQGENQTGPNLAQDRVELGAAAGKESEYPEEAINSPTYATVPKKPYTEVRNSADEVNNLEGVPMTKADTRTAEATPVDAVGADPGSKVESGGEDNSNAEENAPNEELTPETRDETSELNTDKSEMDKKLGMNDSLVPDERRTGRKEAEVEQASSDENETTQVDEEPAERPKDRLIVAALGGDFINRVRAEDSQSYEDADTTQTEDFISRRLGDFNEADLEPLHKSLETHKKTTPGRRQDGLASWLLDPWIRPPRALLVPLKSSTLEKATALWQELESREGSSVDPTDILLVAYDNTGIQLVSRHGGRTSRLGGRSVAGTLSKLKSLQDVELGGRTFSAVADTSRLVPYDSAIIVVADDQPSDLQNKPYAARSLLNKRIKLFAIWLEPSTSDEGQELNDLALSTGGETLVYEAKMHVSGREAPPQNMAAVADTYNWSETMNELEQGSTSEIGPISMDQQLLVLRRGAQGHMTLAVPVDSTVAQLIIRVTGKVERAALYPPSGPLIDLSNGTSVEQFSWGSMLLSADPIEAYLQLDKASQQERYSVVPIGKVNHSSGKESYVTEAGGAGAGVWRFSAGCDSCQYDIAIYARAALKFDAVPTTEGTLRLTLLGPTASVRETSLVNDKGVEVAKIPFRYQKQAGEAGAFATNPMVREVAVPGYPQTQSSALYVQVVGRDYFGESFIRMAGPINFFRRSKEVDIFAKTAVTSNSGAIVNNQEGVNMNRGQAARQIFDNASFTMQVTTTAGEMLTGLQIGSASRLYGSPGETVQMHFEVTNFRNGPVRFRFGATSSLYFLRDLVPRVQDLNSGQTVNVILTAGITSSAQVGARDEVTFVATGTDQVSVSAYLYVVQPDAVTSGGLVAGIPDRRAPDLRHSFTGECTGVLGGNCSETMWSVTFFARDTDSGLLRMSTSPAGLRYQTGFIAGTREEVRAVYRSTCCNPIVLVSAVDLFGNVNTYTLDATQYFTPAAIAAITLGVILFIAILVVIIVAIVICVRRRKRSRELPTYQGSRSVRES